MSGGPRRPPSRALGARAGDAAVGGRAGRPRRLRGRGPGREAAADAADAADAAERAADNGQGPEGKVGKADAAFQVVTLQQFAAVQEEGAQPLLGDPDEALIPCNGDIMIYGDGGAGKTTLALDLVVHWAAGDDWLGIAVPRPLNSMIIEDEGPRPLFRRKVDRKLDGWTGSPIGDRARILEQPWAQFTFQNPDHRRQLAGAIREHDLDVVVVGPLTCAGMEAAGTLQETREFQALLNDVRRLAGRPVTFVLVHHENRAGKVSGAWEGTGDTLLQVTGMGNGRTRLYVQKARWASGYHAVTRNLLWSGNEGFEVEDKPEVDDDTLAEQIVAAVAATPGTGWAKVEEATPGVARSRRRVIRDRLLEDGRLVNIGKTDGVEVALDHVPERKAARLHLPDDPTIRHLRPDPGAGAAQLRLAGGEGGQGRLRRAPRPIGGAGVGAPDSPPENDPDDEQKPEPL